MVAQLRRWLARSLGLDLKHTAAELEQRIARLERMSGPESVLAVLTKDKGE